MALTIDAPPGFRRVSLLVAVTIVALELGLFWVASRLVPMSAVEATTHRDELTVFIVFWTLLTLQAMGAVGVGWVLVALSRTRLSVEDGRIAIAHPWRSWRGAGTEVAELYTSRGWLHLRPRGSIRTWHVRGGDKAAEGLASLRAIVPADAQLSGRAVRRLLIARTIGPWLIVAALGVLGMSLLQRWLDSLR